jgi:transcription antitermination factor NusG
MDDSATCWFALTVKPQHEKVVTSVLQNKGLEGFLPLYRARRRWSDRIKELELPLFPGYIFCRFCIQSRMAVLSISSVTSIVGFGNRPAEVPEEEIDGVKAMIASGLPVGPWPYVKVGQTVLIDRGPLAGLTGVLIREKDAWRVVLTVEMLRRSVAVEIDREMISALSSSSQHLMGAAGGCPQSSVLAQRSSNYWSGTTRPFLVPRGAGTMLNRG